MGTLASRAEIGAWVQAAGTFLRRVVGITLENFFDIVRAKSCNLEHFWTENGFQFRP